MDQNMNMQNGVQTGNTGILGNLNMNWLWLVLAFLLGQHHCGIRRCG